MLSVAEVNRIILSHFAENWTFCPILWDFQNVHEDIDEVLSGSEIKLVSSPFVEFVSVVPMEVPVSHAMRKVDLVLNVILAEPEGQGNKNTLEAIDQLNALYSSKNMRLSKDGIADFVHLDFGEVELGSSELVEGKYLSMASAECLTFF